MASVEVSIDHEDPRLAGKHHREHEPCGVEFTVQLEYAWGSIPGYYYTNWTPPDKCDECEHIFTPREKEILKQKADLAAADYPVNDHGELHYDD